jgi:hypothetical protein
MPDSATGKVSWNAPIEGRCEVFDELYCGSDTFSQQVVELITAYERAGCKWQASPVAYVQKKIGNTWVQQEIKLPNQLAA